MTSRDDEKGELNNDESGTFAISDANISKTFEDMSAETRECLNVQEINLSNSNITKFSIEVDSFKDLNKPLCSFTKIYDRGLECYLTQGKKQKFKPPDGFTGIFDPSNGDMIPLFREADGFWYVYYVTAPNSTEARKLIGQGKILKMLFDTGASASLVGTNDEQNIINRKPSRMICRGAFDKHGVRGKSHGDLRMWAINDKSINGTAENTFKIVKANHVADELQEEFAGMNMADIMQDQLMKENTSVIGGVKNKLGKGARKMTSIEFHSWHGHKGHHPGCRVCELVARSLKRTYVDKVIFHELRFGFRFTMDAIVFSHRSYRGRKYAYTFIDESPSGYLEGFTLVLRSDLCDVFFEQVRVFRKRFQPEWNYPLFRELKVDCAGEHVSAQFQAGCIDNDIDLQYGSDRKENMGLAEVTMKHRELGTKKGMIERNMLVEEWEYTYEQDEWLTVRYPKMKDLRSNDGDAPSPLEMMSNGRISRSMINTELQNFVPVGQLCHVKAAQSKSKGSNLATACRSEIAVAVGMVSGVVKWMDVKTKARFRSNDWQPIHYSACISWQEFCGLSTKPSTLSMQRAIDKKVIKGDRMRLINIHEIGSNTRGQQEHSEMQFDADADEPTKDGAAENLDQAESNNDTNDPTPEVVVHDNSTDPNIGAISQHQQDSLSYLHDDPLHFKNHEVTKHWTQGGGQVSCTGIIYDIDDDGQGKTLWGVQWSDGTKSDFDITEMRKFCVLQQHGPPNSGDWINSNCSDITAVKTRLGKLKVSYYVTKENDSWSKICNSMKINYNQRQMFYDWLSTVHGYGAIAPDDSDRFEFEQDDKPPWMKFYDPYSTFHAKTRQLNKFRKGVPFPYPCGGVWEKMLQQMNSEKNDNPNQVPKAIEGQILMMESMNRRLQKLYADIDQRYESQIDDILSIVVEGESANQKQAKKAMKKFSSEDADKSQDRMVNARVYATQIISDNAIFVCDQDTNGDSVANDGGDRDAGADTAAFDDEEFAGRLDDEEFALNVMLELAEHLKFSKEQLDAFAKMPPPKDFEEAMTRPDAKLYELATAVELSAFDKYDVIEHNISRSELAVRGIDGKTIPLQLLYEVKKNEDGSYLKHKCRCILLGHQGFLTAGLDFEETYAPAPEHFSNLFLQAYALTQDWKRDGFDISTAYLQSDVKHNECGTIVMSYPKGFGSSDNQGRRKVALLKKPIYGHPSSARAWAKTVFEWTEEFFMSNGWHVGTNNTDPCVFVLLSPENTFSIMWIHTDDCFVRGERDEDLDYIRNSFGNRFGIKRVDPRFMLGLYANIIVVPDGSKVLEFTQPDFVESMLSEFGQYVPSKTFSTPFKPSTVLGCKEVGYDPSAAEQRIVKERKNEDICV